MSIFALCRVFCIACITFGPASSAWADSSDSHLKAVISQLDQDMFAAFNRCDGDGFGHFLSEDVEFYHDDDGVVSRDALIEAVNTAICGNFTRALIEDSLEVWEIPGFGAIQSGVHVFTNAGADAPHGEGRFLHIWKREGDRWVVSRIVSYAHGPFQAPAD